jgi:hypothetical protein
MQYFTLVSLFKVIMMGKPTSHKASDLLPDKGPAMEIQLWCAVVHGSYSLSYPSMGRKKIDCAC